MIGDRRGPNSLEGALASAFLSCPARRVLLVTSAETTLLRAAPASGGQTPLFTGPSDHCIRETIVELSMPLRVMKISFAATAFSATLIVLLLQDPPCRGHCMMP